MAQILIKYDDLDLSNVVTELEVSSPTRVNPIAVPKRHGALIVEPAVMDARRISMRGIVQEQDSETLRTTMDNMSKVFARHNKKLRIYDDRYINAYVLTSGWVPIEGTVFASAAFTVDFFCADPFWYLDATQTDNRTLNSSDTQIDITNNYYREQFTFTNNGNAWQYPVFEVTATNQLTRIVIENVTTGRKITYTGTVLVGNKLKVDCGQFLVTNNNTEDLINFNGSFLWLVPGANTLRYEGSIVAEYKMDLSPRMY